MEDTLDEVILRKENAKYLLKIGNLLSNSCPAASRFYMSNIEKRLCEFPSLLKNKVEKPVYCHHCGSIWNSSNCKIKTQPRQRLNLHLKKLKRMERNEEWKLNSRQKKKLRRYYESVSKIVYKCLICKKVTSFPGSKTKGSSLHTRMISTTSTPKLKLNKSDINAGLFIPSPVVTSENEKSKLDKSEISIDNSAEISSTSLNSSNNASENMNSSSNYEPSFSSFKGSPELNSKKQSSAKRKKTLLAQILDQEQNKKKKVTLSSFLVSL